MKKYYFLIIVALILGLVLTGCSLLSNISQVPATEQSGMTYVTKGGPTVNEAESFPLYAGQDWEVGEVLVWNDENKVCVKYRLFDGTGEDPKDVVGEGWGLTETHLAIEASLEDIPHNKSGNPKVGHFFYGNDKLAGVAEDGPYCKFFGTEEGELDVECTETLVIAAHAVIEKTECEIVVEAGNASFVSDATTMVTEGNVLTTYPFAAVPTDAGTHYGVNTWINQTGSDSWDPTPPTPTWIWQSNPVVNPIAGDIVWFEKTFNVPGTPIAGELKIAVDNAYAVWLNGQFVGSDNLFQFVGANDDYDTTSLGDLKQAYVDTTTWQTVGMFDLSSYLETGENVLKILGVNEYMNPDDNPNVNVGTALLNPGGMAFQFTVDWDGVEECTTYSESAWGALKVGEIEIVEGKSWGTYFEYERECPPVLMDTILIDPSISSGIDSIFTLDNEVLYELVVSGTWTNRTFERVDAKYCSGNNWATDGTEAPGLPGGPYPDELLELFVDAAEVDWGVYSNTHIYSIDFSGTGSTVHFAINDSNYGDNINSSMQVEIWTK